MYSLKQKLGTHRAFSSDKQGPTALINFMSSSFVLYTYHSKFAIHLYGFILSRKCISIKNILQCVYESKENN